MSTPKQQENCNHPEAMIDDQQTCGRCGKRNATTVIVYKRKRDLERTQIPEFFRQWLDKCGAGTTDALLEYLDPLDWDGDCTSPQRKVDIVDEMVRVLMANPT